MSAVGQTDVSSGPLALVEINSESRVCPMLTFYCLFADLQFYLILDCEIH